MFSIFSRQRRERRTYSGIAFISRNSDALLGLLPAELVAPARKKFLRLEDLEWTRLTKLWTIGRSGDCAIVLYMPPNGLEREGCVKVMADFNPNGLEIGYSPWPWEDDPTSVVIEWTSTQKRSKE